MLNKHDLKVLLRSGSWDFMRNSRRTPTRDERKTYVWAGNPIEYRPGTSDAGIIYQVLLKSGNKAEYALPPKLSPKVILDIGANIGITSVYLANQFPKAKIYAFEPVPENFELLKRNTVAYPNVKAFCVALGARDGSFEINLSDNPDNFGGFSFHDAGSNTTNKINVVVRQAQQFMDECGIDRVDLIKIDTEGSEYEILSSISSALLQQVTWIVGELHGNKDYELFTMLDPWFDLGVKKTLGKRLYMFNACNRHRVADIVG